MLKDLIVKRKIKTGVIGLGYVGLPLAVEIANKGLKVIGIDIDRKRVKQINKGISVISDVPSSVLKPLVKTKKIQATSDSRRLKDCDVILICVPTPVNINKEPDLGPVIKSTKEIKKHLRKGQLIILKSTTYPETTEKVILPILSESGLKVGRDFYLAFCPERIDPGNKRFGVVNTPTVIGGVTKKCTMLATLFYKQFVKNVHPVSSPKVAEMTKLLENTFRNVNIALVNEFAQLCERMGDINIWEVIEAAKTKPFGFMPFYPGPGVGGHCIPIDPYYLSWKAREYDFHTVFIELSARVNEEMPYFTVNKTIESLSHAGVCPNKAKVLLLGMAFKKDISDLRDSPAIKVYQIIKPKVRLVRYNDPYVPVVLIENKKIHSVKLTKKELKKYDAVVILTDHSVYDYDFIVKNSRLIIDTRNAIKKRTRKVKKLGAG
ncbi:MAG TPA: nucleotide sugar dehydrogenase [candidate division WOR-3 bacterium]|uniref:Nucleotide sugar dehydrogenase n=1 Tax=candidate division WOR-3 bacterium TaxID=2052148 RepID=A0A9C9ELB5_UNCW3|nr:nucleotide sugar dehydrogenase [candidate division WOR-3 bacterium]